MKTPRINVAGVIIRKNKLLLAEFNDESGLHYNFPGGGVDLNEPMIEAVKREVWEETRAQVSVGKLLVVYEFIPPDNDRYGNFHKIMHLFACELEPDSEPYLPETPDKHQMGIRWVDLDDLHGIHLLPDLGDDLLPIIRGQTSRLFLSPT